MKKFKILFLLIAFCNVFHAGAQTSSEVLDKAVSVLTKSSGLSCSFKIDSREGDIKGNFKSAGNKFKLETQMGTTWFDGIDMWTLNPRSKQITLVKPTKSEINEINPFSYMNSYKNAYRSGFSKRKDNNRFLVVLNPKNTKDNIKAVEIAINKKTFLPERFIIRDKNDQVTTLYINSLNINSSFPASSFVCPVQDYKEFELVDLR